MAKASRSQEIRIIGGKWRGRKLRFAGNATLRPTQGKMRETLFNWIRANLPDSRCLDLFAGSGALGFEALSQGAAGVVMVDSNTATINALKANRDLLKCNNFCHIYRNDACRYLQGLTKAATRFDMAFLDPPFDTPELAINALKDLLEHSLVRHRIYLEMRTNPAAQDALIHILASHNWQISKNTQSGESQAVLLQPTIEPA